MTAVSRVLLADDDALSRGFLCEAFESFGCKVVECDDGFAAIKMLEKGEFDLVVTDLRMPRKSGMDVLAAVRDRGLRMPVVLVTAYGTVDVAIDAMRAGAADVLVKPIDLDQIELFLARIGQRNMLVAENEYLRSHEKGPDAVFHSGAMREIVSVIDRVATSSATVLVTGESGTGKEVVATELHERSNRAAMPFVKVNCAAIPDSLIESEFFGHEAGAFTGATSCKIGRFELANRGTLLLDEIGEISLPMQAKLLRVIEDGVVQRVGGSQSIQVDVRIVAATNGDLEELSERGAFRPDLYYRLNIVPIRIPPLRERREDILPLAEYFLGLDAQQSGGTTPHLTAAARDRLQRYSWPGNVRELRNLVQRAALLAADGHIDAPQLDQWLAKPRVATPRRDDVDPIDTLVGCKLRDVEDAFITATLERTGGNRSEAARLLGISPRTLYNRLRELKLKG